MRILIVTPAERGSTTGNRITAERWARILRTQGHRLNLLEAYDGAEYDLLVALHARRSAKSVAKFRKHLPDGKVIVALTGTDLNRDLGRSPMVEATLQLADRIVLIEPVGGRKLKQRFQKKTHVIFQSSTAVKNPPQKLKRYFEVSVIGHLRPVKDPLRTAIAAGRLPGESRVRVVHFGQALSAKMARLANREAARNDRYRWFGGVSHGEAKRRLARSRLTVLSSESEGGPSVISEAIMNDIPILATRIDAVIGMLGANHPGLFDFGDTRCLSELIWRAETDKPFYQSLVAAGKKLRNRFAPRAEFANWKKLLEAFPSNL